MKEQINGVIEGFLEENSKEKEVKTRRKKADNSSMENIMDSKIKSEKTEENNINSRNFIENQVIRTKKPHEKMKNEIKKITKQYIINKTSSFLKNSENIAKIRSFSELKESQKNSIEDLFANEISQIQMKYINTKIKTFTKNSEKKGEIPYKKKSGWLTKRFLDKTKENLYKKDPFLSSKSYNNQYFEENLECFQEYGKALKKKEDLLQFSARESQ